MWLLDANMPLKLVTVLNSLGVKCDTAEARGWKTLSNGKLATTAFNAGFNCLLTKDKGFADEAAKALVSLPKFAIILIRINQMKEKAYLDEFQKNWKNKPIVPAPGKVTVWP